MTHARQFAFADKPPISIANDSMSPLQRTMVRLVERATGQRKLKSVYDQFRADGGTEEIFWSEIMRRTGIRMDIRSGGLHLIPPTGPLLVVANHPYGLVDGFALCWMISQVRSDFQLLINSALIQAPETRRYMLPIDFAGTREAQATNIRSRADARRHLEAGGCVLVFPAGGISTSPDPLGRRPAMDAPWQAFVAQLLQRARCLTLPVYFHGQNSRTFQIASHRSQVLRLALMAGEIRRRFGTSLGIEIGQPIPYTDLAHVTDRTALASELCRRTYELGGIDTTHPGLIVGWPAALQVKPQGAEQ